ncbi:hypothetical protein ATCC90586_003163 [Pythium insidiosum]|nr:hypothetical protein ATCC90586_003163 [Pythium insidiosum]
MRLQFIWTAWLGAVLALAAQACASAGKIDVAVDVDVVRAWLTVRAEASTMNSQVIGALRVLARAAPAPTRLMMDPLEQWMLEQRQESSPVPIQGIVVSGVDETAEKWMCSILAGNVVHGIERLVAPQWLHDAAELDRRALRSAVTAAVAHIHEATLVQLAADVRSDERDAVFRAYQQLFTRCIDFKLSRM